MKHLMSRFAFVLVCVAIAACTPKARTMAVATTAAVDKKAHAKCVEVLIALPQITALSIDTGLEKAELADMLCVLPSVLARAVKDAGSVAEVLP
jgi:hypothetical protein